MNRTRTGFTVFESCVAAALLSAALALSVAMLASVARQRQAAERHARAVLAADNLLERIAAEPYEALTTERVAELCEESQSDATLGESSATVDVAAGMPPGKKITVAVDWQPSGHGPTARHQVVTWRFQREARP